MDQAGWHKAKDLKLPNTIRLLFLPSYSPELNPLKNSGNGCEKVTHNTLFHTLEDMMDAWNMRFVVLRQTGWPSLSLFVFMTLQGEMI
jgi:hypothetical protein